MAQVSQMNGRVPSRTRIVILGGGFGGVYTARHLERLCRRRPDVEIILVSRDNFLLMTPLLFEVWRRPGKAGNWPMTIWSWPSAP